MVSVVLIYTSLHSYISELTRVISSVFMAGLYSSLSYTMGHYSLSHKMSHISVCHMTHMTYDSYDSYVI